MLDILFLQTNHILDEDVLGLILGVPPEVLPVTAAKPIEEVERTPLGSCKCTQCDVKY